MTKQKTTKRALLMSALSLLMCVSMLIGSTFAWFTDSVTSGNNIIKSGNLDVELEYKKVVDGVATEWATVKDKTDIFDPNALWEPGHVEVVYLKVSNLGSLELKYQLGVNVIKETLGKTETGTDIKLSDHLVFKAVEITADQVGTYTRESAKTDAGTEKGLKDYNGETTQLEVGGKDYVALLVYMPETVGNEANYRGTDIPTIELGINLYATQYTAEEDSFDEFYDKNAWVDGMKVYNAADLVSALANEDEIILVNDIATDEVIKLKKDVAINLNGKTLSASLDISDDVDVSIENGKIANTDRSVSGIQVNKGEVTLENVEISSARHAVRVEGGEVTINGGTYIAKGSQGMTQHALNVSDGAKVTVNGGTFIGPKGTNADSGAAVNVQKDSTVIINGGNFSGGKLNTLAANGTLRVYGGTFDQNPAAYVADGFKAVDNDDGTYIVLPGEDTERITDGLYKDSEGTHYVTNANGLSYLNTIISKNVKTVKLLADIDMTNKAWTMVDMHADAQGKLASFDGNGHTISNFVINGEAMFSRIASAASDVTFADLTFENVTINSTKSNTAIIVKQTYKNLVLDNVDVKGAKISGETKVATLVGTVFNEKDSTVTLTVKDCDISNVEITGNPDAASEERLAGLVAWVADKYSNEAIVLENNTMTNVAINSNSTASEHHALIYISDKSASNRYGVYHNEDAGVTLTDCTYMRKVADGYYVDLAGDCYIYNANGLQSLKTWMDGHSNNAFWGKTYNIMNDIDATDVEWTTKFVSPDSTTFKGITFNGNGHTISNLTINGQGLFSGATKGGDSNVPSVFKDVVFDNVTVNGSSHHNGVIWGEAYGDITVDGVEVINSKISGGCNVGALIGRNGEKASTIKFIDCTVKNTKVEATQAADYAGASAFLGMALKIEGARSVELIFEGTNVSEGNTLTTGAGMYGGGIYTAVTYETNWENPTVVNEFTNFSAK